MITYVAGGPQTWQELLFPDLVHLYRIRCRCIRDVRRLIWATWKSIMILWLFMTLLFLAANCYFYSKKWDLCSLPMAKISAKVMNMEVVCRKVKENREILPYVMRKKILMPLIYQILIIAAFCGVGLIGNLMDDKRLTHYAAYILASIWCYDYYQNIAILFNIEAYLYSSAQLCLFLAFCSMFIYCVTLHLNYHIRAVTEKRSRKTTTEVTDVIVIEKPSLSNAAVTVMPV